MSPDWTIPEYGYSISVDPADKEPAMTPDPFLQGDGILADETPDADVPFWPPSQSPHVWRKLSNDPRCVCHDRTMEDMLADGTYYDDPA